MYKGEPLADQRPGYTKKEAQAMNSLDDPNDFVYDKNNVQNFHQVLYDGKLDHVIAKLNQKSKHAKSAFAWPDHLPMTAITTVLVSKSPDDTKIALMDLLLSHGASPSKALTMAALWDSVKVVQHLLHVPNILEPENNSPLKILYVAVRHRNENIVMLLLKNQQFVEQLRLDNREYFFVDDYLFNQNIRPIRSLTCEVTRAKCFDIAYRCRSVMMQVVEAMIALGLVVPREVYNVWIRSVMYNPQNDSVSRVARKYKSDCSLNANPWRLLFLLVRYAHTKGRIVSKHPLFFLDDDLLQFVLSLVC